MDPITMPKEYEMLLRDTGKGFDIADRVFAEIDALRDRCVLLSEKNKDLEEALVKQAGMLHKAQGREHAHD